MGMKPSHLSMNFFGFHCCQQPGRDQNVEIEHTHGLASSSQVEPDELGVHIPPKENTSLPEDEVTLGTAAPSLKEFTEITAETTRNEDDLTLVKESVDSDAKIAQTASLEVASLDVQYQETVKDEVQQGTSVMRLDTAEHQEPLSGLGAICVFFAIIVPNAALIICFSSMCYGLDVYNAVAPTSMSLLGDAMLSGSVLLACILLIFDWWKMPFPLKVVTGTVCVLIFYAGSLFKGRKYPWGIMLIIMFLEPAFIGLLRFSVCIKTRRQKFYTAVSAFSFFAAVVILVIWLCYIYVGKNEWDRETKDELVSATQPVYDYVYPKRKLNYEMDCGLNKVVDHLSKDERADLKYYCSQAATLWFISWTAPFIAVGCNFVIAAFCLLTGVLTSTESVTSIQRSLTRFLLTIAFLLSGMYATATMSATSIRLGATMLAFFCAALAILCIWIYLEINPAALVEASKNSKLIEQFVKIWSSDWSKAVMVGAIGGPAIFFFVLNYLCQLQRKCRGVTDDPNSSFTKFGRDLVEKMSVWNWTSIFLKITLLGELFFTLQVGVAKVTYVFLSWLNTTLANTNIGIVCLLVYLIGSAMFLLPPVPGLPVYVFAGILIGEKGRQDENIGFWLGCIIAMVLGLFTKLCACVGQYFIGYYLGKSLKVQQLIGVDKVPTRAIEQVLKSRGLNPSKVAILVGGPDWPTSVTCGIVRVNIPQMIIGTIPVITLLAPCIFAGACMGRVSPGEDSVWNMAANAFTATAAVVNMASMAYAVYAIGNVVQKHGEDLAKPRPEHEAVAELTRAEQSAVDSYNEVSGWDTLSTLMRTIVASTAVLMLLSNGIMTCFAEVCFASFAVSSKISDPYELDGLNGNVINIVKPLGVVPLVMFLIGVILHIVFVKIMARRAEANLKTKGGNFRRSSMIRI